MNEDKGEIRQRQDKDKTKTRQRQECLRREDCLMKDEIFERI